MLSLGAVNADNNAPGFQLAYGDAVSTRAVNFVSIAGGSRQRFEVISGPHGTYQAQIDGQTLPADGPRSWVWLAGKEPGFHHLSVTGPDGDVMLLTLAVERSAEQTRDGVLNGYRIGDYPGTPLRGLPIFHPPAGYVEVHEEHLDIPVSPRFLLGQFLCKQPSGFPRYLVLRERLLLKLEYLLDRLHDAGRPVSSFHVMSGYRTPDYNTSIGNGHYSRHVWGGAADIFIDEQPRDGVMDDLNGDGRIDRRDAVWLTSFIERLATRDDYQPYIGGLSAYGATAAHGPFVHVDVRGWPARW